MVFMSLILLHIVGLLLLHSLPALLFSHIMTNKDDDNNNDDEVTSSQHM